MRIGLFCAVLLWPALVPAKRIDLVVPPAGSDLSAYRFDSELFGFDRSGSEVAAVGLEVARASQGRQRGEGFLLVYRAGSALPVRNVIIRAITHPDMPKNPLPLDTAAGVMGFLNDDWMRRWAHRPQRRHLPGNMLVEPLVTMLPAPAHGAGSVDDTLEAPVVDNLKTQASGQLCTPYVGAKLTWHGQVRQTAYIPLDLAARCDLLRSVDKQVAWGRPDSAALTLGFAFNSRPTNEESGKFVVLARWAEAKPVTLALVGGAALPNKVLAEAHKVLAPYGHVVKRPPREHAATGIGSTLVAIEANDRWLALGEVLAERLGVNQPTRVHLPHDHETITFVFGEQPPAPNVSAMTHAMPARQPAAPKSATITRSRSEQPKKPPTPAGPGPAAATPPPSSEPPPSPSAKGTFLEGFGQP